MSINARLTRLSRALVCAGALSAGTASAAPILQLYIEGASYDTQSESWYVPTNSNFTLWAIGNLEGPGGSGGLAITNVRLAAVYDTPATGQEVTITITPTTIGVAGSYGGFTDPSAPGTATWLQTVSDGSTPLLGDHRHLPNHGEYGQGRVWQEFALSNFVIADSQLGDFVGDFPLPSAADLAQIHAYTVTVNGGYAHFDLYGEIANGRGRTSYVFAPPSYDATDGPNDVAVPVPATLALLGIGALGIAACRRRLGRV